ncbi:stalk domain-containing protein [Paenibacillus thalictri]|nr:stalk domain-containing protein [Paenibacillus thalictri]
MPITSRLAKRTLLFALAVALWCSGVAIPLKAANAFSYGYRTAPNTTVGITKPSITLYFDTDMTSPPSAFSMKLNGQTVPVIYDHTKKTFTYTPTVDLAPGNYNAQVSITYSGYVPIEQSWSFTVAKNAVGQLPAPSSVQLAGLAALNDYRTIYGLPPVKLNDQLNATATAHAKYLDANKVQQSGGSQASLHDETAGNTGFTGTNPLERSAYYGYTTDVGEDAAYFYGSANESIDVLFDAPYHRTPFLDPSLTEIGFAKYNDYTIIEFGMNASATPQLVVSPAPGDRFVPTTFDGNEEPDPLRMHKTNSYPVGYPIMAQYYGSGIDKIKLVSAQLSDSTGKQVDLLTNDPSNDDKLTNTVMLMPNKPLQADSSYHVKLNLQVTKTGGAVTTETKEWDFTTEPAEKIGKQKLHQNSADYKKNYVTVSPVQRVASFGLDDSSYTVDGVSFPMKRTPVIVDGSSYLYIRDLAAALGASVEWDDQLRAAIYTKGDLKITLYTTKNQYEVNGKVQQTDTPARLVGENTMVPVRLLSEVLGAKVVYTEATRNVKIIY